MSDSMYPPPTHPSTLLTFPQATLSHHLGTHVFPLSSGSCSLVEIISEDEDKDGKTGGAPKKLLALSMQPNTTVLLGKENLVRKTDQNESHASYSFNFSPSPKNVPSSSSAGGMLPTSNQEIGGYLKLKLPQPKNNDEYEDTTALARKFESYLLEYQLLDTRLDADISEDDDENIGSVLSGWVFGSIAGIKQTAGSVFRGAKELVFEDNANGKDKGKAREPAQKDNEAV
ncbi:hypothetical protein [Phaffia rhodozyma]|uniref:Uncharacterized protein n=1 Tax=Phaffia rhodozyma TaxID=264483 RepID=A0A0F7SLJ1_PHARH|nr:hypothetical protein [Phaffia rhodozyma]